VICYRIQSFCLVIFFHAGFPKIFFHKDRRFNRIISYQQSGSRSNSFVFIQIDFCILKSRFESPKITPYIDWTFAFEPDGTPDDGILKYKLSSLQNLTSLVNWFGIRKAKCQKLGVDLTQFCMSSELCLLKAIPSATSAEVLKSPHSYGFWISFTH